MSPLELQSQLESKNGPLERVLWLFQCGPWAKFGAEGASLWPAAPSQAEPRVPLPGLDVAPRAEGHQPAHHPAQKPSITVATASEVGGTGGEAAAAGFDSFHKWSLALYVGFWMLTLWPDKKQCQTCKSYTYGQIFTLNLQNVVLLKKLAQIWQLVQQRVTVLTIWLHFFLISKLWTVRTVCVMFCKSKLWSVGMT